MKSEKSFSVSRVLERYNNLREVYQMVLFFVPFTIIVFAVFLGLIMFIPGGFNTVGFYDSMRARDLDKATSASKTSIENYVTAIVAGINSGKSATDFKSKDFSLFCTIMDEEGELIVHPVFSGMNVKRSAPYIYNEVIKGTVDGIWVDFPVRGRLKISFVKKTKSNLFVSSGYYKSNSTPPSNTN